MTGVLPRGGLASIQRAAVLALAASALWAAEAPIEPLRVCEILENLSAHDGKVVAVQGRYSFRSSGRFLGEESCGRPAEPGEPTVRSAFEVVFDPKAVLPIPKSFEYNASTVYRNLKLIQRHTSLAKFRFGSVEYDRWAVVYGRILVNREFKAGARPATAPKGSSGGLPAQIVCPGESMILTLGEPER